jgi:thiosulfate reductase cytochrome b subunit
MDENPEYICFPVIGTWYSSFLMNIWIWIDFLVYSIIPFIVMGICSMIIIVKIQKNSNNLLKTLSKTSQNDKSNLQRRLKRNRQLLYMLLITNFYFLLSLLPCCLSFLIFGGSETKSSLHQLVVHILLYTNNSINFLFYGFSSEKYRKEFIGFFKSKKEKTNKALSYYVEA